MMTDEEQRLALELIQKQTEVIEAQREVIKNLEIQNELLKNGASFSEGESEGESIARLYNESMGK